MVNTGFSFQGSGFRGARVVLPGLLSILFAGAVVRAATIEGTVLDPSGRAVPNVRVSLLQSLTASLAPLGRGGAGVRESNEEGSHSQSLSEQY